MVHFKKTDMKKAVNIILLNCWSKYSVKIIYIKLNAHNVFELLCMQMSQFYSQWISQMQQNTIER